MRPLRLRLVPLALSLLAAMPSAWANREYGNWGEFEVEEYEGWKEGAYELPPYPEDRDLVEIPIDINRFDFYLDAKHLTLGDDAVVRYTVVVKSKTGASNVFFEGIRCDERQYKSYAYGTSNGELRENQAQEWKNIYRNDALPFRHELISFYFCRDTFFPLPPEKILERINNRFNGSSW